MPESVELNGMTINLVENKATYDAMTKNPNEMYLVEKDYELEFNVITTWNTSTDNFETNIELISGDINNVFIKLFNSDNDYHPKVKFNITFIYFTTTNDRCLILDPLISEIGSRIYPYNRQLVYMTNNSVSPYSDLDVSNEWLVRFSIVFYISDGDDIVGIFDNGLCGVGENAESILYARHKEVILGHFTD